MNKQSAEQKGLQFTGIYSWKKDEVKTRLEEIRSKGYKAYLCNVPPDPLSRGHHGMGYSVYTEPKYQQDERAAEIKQRIARHPAILQSLKEKYEIEVAREEKENNERLQWLKENGY